MWRALSASVQGQTPFFLVGFPRSGTTLLDQILDSHPLIQVIEEQPMLDVLKSMISKLPGGYPEALSTLEEADIQELRKAYCSLLNKFTSTFPDKILIDKYRLNLIHVGLIKAIFPHAKFIFALRHPCDVVLSCFMQPFKLNNAMANFYSLEDSAYLYHRALGLWIKYTGLFAFDYHTVKYEQLVDSFELVIRELFAFLKVDWHDGVLKLCGTRPPPG